MSVDWINPLIAITSAIEARAVLIDHPDTIDAVINVSRYDHHNIFKRKARIEYTKINIRQSNVEDNVLTVMAGIQVLSYNVKKGMRTLVHCTAGKTRSPAIVIGYLMLNQSMSYPEAFASICVFRKIREDMRDVVEKSVGLLLKTFSQ